MASFRDWWVAKLITQFQLDAYMKTFVRALGDFADSIEVRVDNAVKQRFPSLASKGGRAALGDERGLSRPLNATEQQYADKIQNAWVLWPKAGTPLGLLRALADEGYNVTLITQQGRRFTLAPDGNSVIISNGPPWTFQSGITFWNTFALVVRPIYPSGSIPAQSSSEGVAFLNAVEKWRFANALLGEVVWAPGLTWDTFPAGSTWDNQGRPTWDSGMVASPVVWTSF